MPEVKIALWKKETRKGDLYFSSSIEITTDDGKTTKVPLNIFKNRKSKDSQPDFTGNTENSKKGSDSDFVSATVKNEPSKPKDDKVPF